MLCGVGSMLDDSVDGIRFRLWCAPPLDSTLCAVGGAAAAV